MNELVGALLPIFVLWTIPLVPLIYTAIAAALESIRESPRQLLMARPAFALKSRDAVDSEAS